MRTKKITKCKFSFVIGFVLLVLISQSAYSQTIPKSPYPIIFVHGINSSDDTWGDLVNTLGGGEAIPVYDISLNSDGNNATSILEQDVESVDWRSGISESKSGIYLLNFDNSRFVNSNYNGSAYDLSNEAAIYKQGYALKLMINAVLKKDSCEKVILVGHSMGGLAIREYLQRTEDGIHKWWVDSDPISGHKVAKVITIGTPHLGYNSGGGFESIVGVDPHGEAIRDLLHNYTSTPGPYLFGGNEIQIPNWDNINFIVGYFYNIDVNCNNSIDLIQGLNEADYGTFDNDLMPLPLNIKYTWITSNAHSVTDGDGDYVVELSHQWLYDSTGESVPFGISDTILSYNPHVRILGRPGETEDVWAITRGLDEPAEPQFAYKIDMNNSIKGYITFGPFNVPEDIDLYKINCKEEGNLTISLTGNEKSGLQQFSLLDNDLNIKATESNINNVIEYSVVPGIYYISIKGLATDGDDASYKYPYNLNTKFEDVVLPLLSISPLNLLEFFDVFISKTVEKTIKLTNNGTTNISVTGLALSDLNADQFEISTLVPFEIAPAESKEVTVRFKPTKTGEQNAKLTITTNSGVVPMIIISLKGSGTDHPTKILSVNPENLFLFGDIIINKEINKTVKLQSTGTDIVTVTDLLIAGYNKDDYSIASPSVFPFDLASGEVKNIFVNFKPTKSGVKEADLVISNNSDNLSSRHSVLLYGNGIENIYSGGGHTIVALEYWFDNSYGSKIFKAMIPAREVIVFNAKLPTPGLDIGLHSLHIRYIDNKGKWSNVVSEFFHKLPVTTVGSRTITTCEYWFDDDFSNKVSTEITPGQTITTNTGFDVSELQTGLHSYHVRYKDDAGQWSSVVSEFFHKLPVTTAGSREIIASEYWFDDDFASKVSTEITPGQTITTNERFDANSLQAGLHSYHVRYMANAGQWSSVVSEFFHKLPVSAAGSREIIVCEYWFDDDFANKVSSEITAGQTITTNEGFDANSLQTGLHRYHVRYMDNAGQWSSVVSEFFHKLPVSALGERKITAYEYWYDNDYAGKTTVQVTPQQILSLNNGLDAVSLSTGLHSYHVRYKDDAGQWSSVVSEFFHKLPASSTQENLITAYRYWFNRDEENIQITNLAAPANPYELVRDISVSGLPSGENTIHFQFKDTRQAWSSVLTDTFNMESLLMQEIALKTGWNIFSVKLQPSTPDLKVLSQTLIDDGSLVKVQDESGNSLEDWGIFGGWQNNIGNVSPTEGYKIKVNRNDTIKVSGNSVEYPFAIPLKTGWNIAGYPQLTDFSGMNLIQQLLDKGTLIKVQDDGGNSIEDWGIFGGWQNNIGNFTPGEGYKIKVSARDTLWIYENYPKSSVILPELVATTHFQPGFEGNGVDHMNINLVGLPLNILHAGDELAVFDGVTCVGAVTLLPQHLQSQAVSIAASATDNMGIAGFGEGNPVVLRMWDSKQNQEFRLEPEIVKGTSTFTKHETTVANLEKYATTSLEGIPGLSSSEINCYPNPFSDEVTIEINLREDAQVQVEVLNQLGQRVKMITTKKQLTSGVHRLTWNGRNASNGEVAPGIYHLRIEIDDIVIHRKIVLSK